MKITEEAVIWRDPVTDELFHAGTTVRDISCWSFSLELGDIRECFGEAAFIRARNLTPGQPVPLADVLEGEAPENDTPERRIVPLTDAQVLKKLPAFLTTVSVKKLTDKELDALIEKIRWT